MNELLLIGIGGFIGAVLRHVVISLARNLAGAAQFPFGTFTVNLLGCLALGFLAGLANTRDVLTPETRAFLLVGILGAFTTFSTFGYETVAFLREGNTIPAIANVGLHILLGLAAVWAGDLLARMM